MDMKTSKRIPPGTPKYHRLTNENRIIIWTPKKEGKSETYIAARIGCSVSTISRELDRNKGKKGCRHKKAQGMAQHRIAVKAAKRRKFTDKMWKLFKEKLREGWTPQMVVGRCRRDGIPMVCVETLYKEYYRRQDLVRRGLSKEGLPPLPRCQKKRKTRNRDAKKYRNAGRGKIKERVDIDERPKTVENRARVGHWEGDLINGPGGTGHLATLVERMTRFTLVARVASKESGCVMSAIIGMRAGIPKDMLKSCTFDNGKEFAFFKQLEQALGIKVYFAKPYHSWERGTNENRNGVVRKILPKGSPFDAILDEEMRRIDRMLNDRPLKCLNWRTPREAFTALLHRHLLAAA